MDTNDFIGKNGAGDLVLAFFDWGYRTPKAAQAGTKRRIKREDAAAKARKALYADTPLPPVSRQQRRAAARATDKRGLSDIHDLGRRRRHREHIAAQRVLLKKAKRHLRRMAADGHVGAAKAVLS